MFDILRRKRTLGAVESFRSSILELAEKSHLIDPYVLGDHTAALALKTLSRVKPREPGEVSAILRRMSETVREHLQFSFASLFIADVLEAIASKAVDLGPRGTLESAKRALSLIIDYISNSYNALTVNLSKTINYGSSIALLGYSDTILRLVLSISGKLSKVNVFSYWPFMSGRRAALLLRKRGLKADVWPDIAVSQVLESTDYVIMATLGVSSEDTIVGEMGLYSLLLTARDLGRETIALAWSMSMRPSTPPKLERVEKVDHPIERGESIHLPLFDVAPAGKVGALVTEMGIYRAPLENAAEDIYETLLKRVIGAALGGAS